MYSILDLSIRFNIAYSKVFNKNAKSLICQFYKSKLLQKGSAQILHISIALNFLYRSVITGVELFKMTNNTQITIKLEFRYFSSRL